MPDANQEIMMRYTNYRGDTATRTITPVSLRYGSTEWHKEDGWLLEAFDHDRQANREFALADCNFPQADLDEKLIAAEKRGRFKAILEALQKLNELPDQGFSAAKIERDRCIQSIQTMGYQEADLEKLAITSLIEIWFPEGEGTPPKTTTLIDAVPDAESRSVFRSLLKSMVS